MSRAAADTTSLKRSLGIPTLVVFGLAYLVPMTVFTTYGIINDDTGGYLSYGVPPHSIGSALHSDQLRNAQPQDNIRWLRICLHSSGLRTESRLPHRLDRHDRLRTVADAEIIC